MSEDGVYPIVFLPSFLGDVEFEAVGSRSNFGGFEVNCIIGVVRGVVQVIQNWFTGILNPTRISRLG